MSILALPQISIEFAGADFASELILVAGGRAPKERWLQKAAFQRPLWAIDGGLGICHSAHISPHRLIGDGDSAQKADWAWAEGLGIPIDKFPQAKDRTDLQMALEIAKKDFPQAFLLVTGAFGGRFDHAMSLIYSLLGDGRLFCLADEREMMVLLRGAMTANFRLSPMDRPDVVSLLSLSVRSGGVTTKGLLWPLEDAELMRDIPYAISNKIKDENRDKLNFSVKLASGILAVYLNWGMESYPLV